jgi:hypothetical protein
MIIKLANLHDKLLQVFKEHNNIIIAVDFDDTIYDWKSKGYSCDYVLDLVKRCQKELNAKVILFTCRADSYLEFAVKYCEEKGLALHGINENPDYLPTKSKPYFNVMLDDKASLDDTCATLETLLYGLSKTEA